MKVKIPLFELNYGPEEEFAVLETLRSKWISTGPKTAEFEQAFAKMIGVDYAIAVANCTAALHLALILIRLKAGDEVICPSLTFVATVNPIRYVGAVPVFCDITGYDDFSIDPKEIERCITAKTKAIIVMHYAGYPCQMRRILDIAKVHKIAVIEDACHGPLSEYEGKKLGTLGDIGCFSFFSNKNISTAEGGMIVTNNPEYREQALLLRSHGMTSLSFERSKGHTASYDVVRLGYNYRLDDIRSSLGIVQLNKLRADLENRIVLRDYYRKQLSGCKDILIPYSQHKGFVSNYIFPILLKKGAAMPRDGVRKLLQERGIQTSIHYPAVHRFSIYQEFKRPLPKTEYVSDNEITLPMYEGLKFEDIDYIVGSLKDMLT